jgi:hypothetical protein
VKIFVEKELKNMNIKKTLIILILFFSFINISFSYNLTDYDNGILNKIYTKIDSFNNEKTLKLEKKVYKLTKKKFNNERIEFLLLEVYKYILSKKEITNLKNEFKVLKVID